ncbi:unnamed protein product [Acanthoscelides obtectus]|uniref:Origin recognition complex subunit 3 n=1 Tax=Acanthoscelides obtectus TaxID=200917 RepID=A0A9P0LMH6_ACAOB|nr:unnamed protein product [Acanthoscelides obtectus]CAK1664342.1 Origin recognition complex subunit 3 [Acanthoscelides obtectus]
MDEDTISVSKGVFIFNNNIKRSNNRGRRKRTFTTNKTTDDNEIFASNLWYQQYANLKNILEENIMELNDNMFSSVLSELVQFVGSSRKSAVEEIPTAALLTGINMPDHAAQFSTLINKIQQNETPHVACLYSQDCVNIKNMIENMINKLMNSEGETIDDEYAMAEHFCFGNAMSLCTLSKPQTREMVENFTHNDFENVRQLLSFRKLVESETYENRIKLLTDDDYFKDVLIKHLRSIQKYLRRFHLFLKVLHVLVNDLPKAPLGKKIRELYAVAVSRDITKSDEYKESFQLLGFLSKVELISKLSAIIDILSPKLTSVEQNKIAEFVNKLEQYLKSMNDFNMEELQDAVEEIETEALADETIDSRQQFREKLLGMAKQKSAKQLNKYEQLRKEVLDLLSNAFEEYLVEPKSFYLHEIFFFDDVSIQNNIVGTHRTAIHNALNDPQYYLQCSCCEIPNSTSIRHTMPDICIAYKLHLECGKMINLYDWLQAFLSIVDPSDADEESDRYVKPELQARFTQIVTELEYLGFIKNSKRKADHVARLTWGG